MYAYTLWYNQYNFGKPRVHVCGITVELGKNGEGTDDNDNNTTIDDLDCSWFKQ